LASFKLRSTACFQGFAFVWPSSFFETFEFPARNRQPETDQVQSNLRSRRHLSLAVCFIVTAIAMCWMVGDSSSAEDRASSPTTQPDLELPADSPIRKSFTALADPDPALRDQASQDLMGMRADDLPKFRQLIIENQPLAPDQIAALKDIVTQVYLASQKYKVADEMLTDASGSQDPFFLGLLWATDTDPELRLGVPIDERLPGFPGFRFLRRGDMILGIYINPDAALLQFPNTETHNIETLKAAIAGSPRSQSIALQVLRDGQILKIPLKMAPRPLYAENPEALRSFISDRTHNADRYWHETYAPLLGQDIQQDAD
jgi:hypothetical protein